MDRLRMDETRVSIDREPGTRGTGCGGDPFAERPVDDVSALLSRMKGGKIFANGNEVEVHLPVRLGPPFTIMVGRGRSVREAIEAALALRSAKEAKWWG